MRAWQYYPSPIFLMLKLRFRIEKFPSPSRGEGNKKRQIIPMPFYFPISTYPTYLTYLPHVITRSEQSDVVIPFKLMRLRRSLQSLAMTRKITKDSLSRFSTRHAGLMLRSMSLHKLLRSLNNHVDPMLMRFCFYPAHTYIIRFC